MGVLYCILLFMSLFGVMSGGGYLGIVIRKNFFFPIWQNMKGLELSKRVNILKRAYDRSPGHFAEMSCVDTEEENDQKDECQTNKETGVDEDKGVSAQDSSEGTCAVQSRNTSHHDEAYHLKIHQINDTVADLGAGYVRTRVE